MPTPPDLHLSRIIAIGRTLKDRIAASAPEIKTADAGRSSATSQARKGG